jgi:hypothetical protein
MIQIQYEHKEKENKTLDKARIIAASKRLRRCTTEESRNIWLVGSGNPKTPRRFYKVVYDESVDIFMCDCKSFQFTLEVCKHVYACAIAEGSHS